MKKIPDYSKSSYKKLTCKENIILTGWSVLFSLPFLIFYYVNKKYQLLVNHKWLIYLLLLIAIPYLLIFYKFLDKLTIVKNDVSEIINKVNKEI